MVACKLACKLACKSANACVKLARCLAGLCLSCLRPAACAALTEIPPFRIALNLHPAPGLCRQRLLVGGIPPRHQRQRVRQLHAPGRRCCRAAQLSGLSVRPDAWICRAHSQRCCAGVPPGRGSSQRSVCGAGTRPALGAAGGAAVHQQRSVWRRAAAQPRWRAALCACGGQRRHPAARQHSCCWAVCGCTGSSACGHGAGNRSGLCHLVWAQPLADWIRPQRPRGSQAGCFRQPFCMSPTAPARSDCLLPATAAAACCDVTRHMLPCLTASHLSSPSLV